MKTFIVLFLGLMVAGSSAAQEWDAVVLKASSLSHDSDGKLVIKLLSGTIIKVSKGDWSNQWSEAVNEAIKNQEMEKTARSTAEPPSDAAAASMIRSHCAKEWPDDFQMRKYCEDKQYEGLRALRARQMTGVLSKIRSKCANEWPDDFQMRDYCEKKQIEALRKLNR